MSKLTNLIEQIRESEAFQQLKAKYDELDGQTKFYVNIGALAAAVLLVFISVLTGIIKVNGLKSDLNEKEELVGYLQRSADTIRQLRAQQQAAHGSADMSSLPGFITTTMENSGIPADKAEVGKEQAGVEDKETKESFVDVKLSQINLRQLTRFLFNLTHQGGAKSINVKDLAVDTKGDPSGYIDAVVTVASYKAK